MMKKIVLFLLLHFAGTSLIAQNNFAVIKDSDEFVNVRQAGIQSRVIGKLLKYQPFDCMTEEDVGQKIKDMVYVEYEKFSKGNGNICKNVLNDSIQLSGYVHISRVYRLRNMPQLNLKSTSTDKMIFANDTIQVSIESAQFNAKEHTMRDPEGKVVTQTTCNFASERIEIIDGQRVWGADGNIPRSEIKSITILQNGKIFTFLQAALKNIFEPAIDKDYTKVCLGIDGEIYIWMQNSDGTGSYNVIWVVLNGEIKYMYTGISWYA